MTIQLIVPTLGESITEATVSKWLKKVGESFEIDEPLVEIETDKITVEVPAPSAGVLSEIKAVEGTDINIGGVLAIIGDSNSIGSSNSTEKKDESQSNENKNKSKEEYTTTDKYKIEENEEVTIINNPIKLTH